MAWADHTNGPPAFEGRDAGPLERVEYTPFQQEFIQTGLTGLRSCDPFAKTRFVLSLFYGVHEAVATTVVFPQADAVAA